MTHNTDPAHDWEHVPQPEPPGENQPMQSEDGRPHLTYYIWPHTLSFVWAGEPDEEVEVCVGGYGEPVQFTFSPRTIEDVTGLKLTQMPDAPVLLAAFKTTCDAWARGRGYALT